MLKISCGFSIYSNCINFWEKPVLSVAKKWIFLETIGKADIFFMISELIK